MSEAPLLDQLRDRYGAFSRAQRRLCGYVLSNLEKAAFMTASELAVEARVSEATVLRFPAQLGRNGYRDFQRELREALPHRMTTAERLSMLEGLTSEEVLRSCFHTDRDNLRMTEDRNSPSTIDSAVRILDEARTVYLLGSRSSWPLVQFLDYYLRYMLYDVRVIRFEGSDVYTQTLDASDKDVVLALSFPRYSTLTIEVMEYLKEMGVQSITMTDSPQAPPARIADLTLTARSYMTSFVDSFVAPLALINVLIVKLGLLRRKQLFANFEKLEEIWEEHGTYAAGKHRESTDE